ncbi:MAG: tryptophan synthase subunit alpha [Anaerolineales bacterium]
MGFQKIRQTFYVAHQEHRAAFMPYFTLGFPNEVQSMEIIQGIAENGADLIELGIPFSDPLADGAVIQHSSQIALQQGMNVKKALQCVTNLRKSGVNQALVLMGYINPILSYGSEKFVEDAAKSGADGLIIPDLPLQEAGDLENYCVANGLALIPMIAPNSTNERISMAAKHALGFLYLVSLTGVTGERSSLAANLRELVERVRKFTQVPLAVGFGISTPAQAAAVAQISDGVIVGSAIIRAANTNHKSSVNELVRQLRMAMKKMNNG